MSETRAYDEWVSVLTNRGYMVLQPQYRGSQGYGIDHWLSSWGQWGITMSDDKDDGVRYLVEQGLADPDQVAMFGWSYGGYAAFAAAVRQPPVYNCAIAGAGVSDLDIIQRDFGGSPIQSELIEEGYTGMSPNEFAGRCPHSAADHSWRGGPARSAIPEPVHDQCSAAGTMSRTAMSNCRMLTTSRTRLISTTS